MLWGRAVVRTLTIYQLFLGDKRLVPDTVEALILFLVDVARLLKTLPQRYGSSPVRLLVACADKLVVRNVKLREKIFKILNYSLKKNLWLLPFFFCGTYYFLRVRSEERRVGKECR